MQLSKRDLNEVYSRKLKDVEKSFSREIDAESSLLKHQLCTVKDNHKSAQNIINPHIEDLVNSYTNLTDYYLFNTNSILNQINTDKISFNNQNETDKLPLLADKTRIEKYVKELKNSSSKVNKERILFLDMLIYDVKMNPPESDFKAYRNLKTLIIENSGKLSRQMLYFYLQRSLEHIQKIKFSSLPVTVDIYILKAKIFYMIGHLDSALAVADSFRHFIKGNKQLSDFHKVNLINFVKYFKVMLRLSVKTDKSKIKKLSEELQNMNNTKEKKWLIEKIEALI